MQLKIYGVWVASNKETTAMLDTTNYLKALALKWSSKHHAHAARINKGLALALAGKAAPRTATEWRVCGSSRVEYTVKVECGYPSCTCKDFEFQGRCKHVWATAMLTRLAQEIEESLLAPTPPAVMAAKRVAA
jgi:uncharacterized Zn finger protein